MTTGETASNGYDKKTVNSFAARIDAVDEELESLRGKYMSECKARREDIKEIYAEAKDKGIPQRAFKAVRKANKYARKAERARDDLEPDEQDSFDLIAEALGADFASFGLGKATVDKAAAKNATVNSLSS